MQGLDKLVYLELGIHLGSIKHIRIHFLKCQLMILLFINQSVSDSTLYIHT